MRILLFGKPNSITSTLANMLQFHQQWNIRVVTPKRGTIPTGSGKNAGYNLLIANLDGFNRKLHLIIRDLKERSSSTPLLVLYSYKDPMLITPILKAGANGYLQNGYSEEDIFEAARTVAAGNSYIKPRFTYSQ
jgi:DNA-binding NarL/FixJ family response regulator